MNSAKAKLLNRLLEIARTQPNPMTKLEKARRWFKRLAYVPVLMSSALLVGSASLSVKHFDANGHLKEDRGVVSVKKVTGAFVTFIVAQMVTESSEIGDFKYHDSGTGSTAEANTQTALVTPTGVARATGTQVAGGTSTAPTYTSVATITYNGTYAVVEHAIFSQSTSATMLDRSVFSAVNVVNLESIQFTYVLTINAEA